MKQTKVRQVALNRLNDSGKKDIYICASTTKKSVEGRKEEKKKRGGTFSQTLNEHYYSERFVGAM